MPLSPAEAQTERTCLVTGGAGFIGSHLVEHLVRQGHRVIVVDDVCTSGGSILEACDKVEAEGYEVAATMCVVDREEGGTGAVRSRYPFYPIFTATDLLSGPGAAAG